MFYQVRTPVHHSDLLRFFWFGKENEICEYRLKVHVFGATTSQSVCNYVLKQTASHESCTNEVSSSIKNNFYVDDYLKSCATIEKTIENVQGVKNTISEGGFELYSFVSNRKEVIEAICAENPSEENASLVGKLNEDSRALGVFWNTKRDTIGFNVNVSIDCNKIETKRSMLRILASVYDPLGIASPVLMVAKSFFQDSCRLKLDWDDPLPPRLLAAWDEWKIQVKSLENYEISRCMKLDNEVISTELHIFCDGSEKAYGAVAYCRHTYFDKSCSTSLICSKSRLTPLNNSTIKTVPRIELCAAKLASELSHKLLSELEYKIDRVRYWTDSITVMKYLKNESRRFHRFVSNKISFILNFTSSNDWFYVPTKMNPADIISRGSSPENLMNSELWNKGPTFLRSYEMEIPPQNIDTEIIDDNEVKVVLTTKIEEHLPLDTLMESSSTWVALKTKVAWFHRIKKFLRKEVRSHSPLSVDDFRVSEIIIFKYLQNKYFSNEMNCSRIGSNLPNSSPITNLSPFLDEHGVLRVGGRLENSSSPYNTKHPIILPPCSITDLFIKETHAMLGHMGRETVLNAIRKNYWIVRGNSSVRKIIKNCMTCRKVQSKPIVQQMAPLPASRVTGDSPPFTSVGCDFFGPFYVKQGRKEEKRYGVIFTCLASRAAHIEIAHSLSTDSFVNALRRFICRRGNVQEVLSDNGTNLKSGYKEIKKSIDEWNENAIHNFLRQRNISWKFNPPYSSHFSGIYEREIRTIRKVFGALLTEQPMKLSDENLNTLMCEIESTLNSIPLTEVTSDVHSAAAITPNDLLLLNSGCTYPPGIFNKGDVYAKRRWKQIQYLADVFWRRWSRQYLSSLQRRQKWSELERNIAIGDLVLVVDVNLPRNLWPLGRVHEVIRSRDGLVRSARVRISRFKSTEDNNGSDIVHRPIAKLVLLRAVEDL